VGPYGAPHFLRKVCPRGCLFPRSRYTVLMNNNKNHHNLRCQGALHEDDLCAKCLEQFTEAQAELDEQLRVLQEAFWAKEGF